MLSYRVIDRDHQRLIEELEAARQSSTRPILEKPERSSSLPGTLTRRLQHRLHLASV